jgi:hypothetical protein
MEITMPSASPIASVLDEVATWPGVRREATRRAAAAVLFANHELGHVHPTAAPSTFVPDERRAEVLAAGCAKEWFADWVSKPIADAADAADAQDGVALLRERDDELSAR